MTFTNTEYEAEIFRGLVLPETRLEEVTFYDCRFEACQLTEVSFRGSRFTNCTFTACDLSLSNVTDAEFTDTRFENSVAVAVNWALMTQNPHLGAGLDFFDCTLKYAVFNGLDLHKTSFVNCVLHDVDFHSARLLEADFGGADLQAAAFNNCDLRRANFAGASNYQLNVLNNKLRGAKFSVPEVLGLLAGLDIELV